MERPIVKLIGGDGNAYAIMAACKIAARNAGWTPDQVEDLMAEMKSGDYDHLLQVVLDKFDVE